MDWDYTELAKYYVKRPGYAPQAIRGLLRIFGTVTGLLLATVMFHFLPPGAGLEVLLIAAFVFLLRCVGPANYGIFAITVSALVVLLVTFTGVSPKDVILARGINTATAISYQDEFKVSQRTKLLLDALDARSGAVDRAELEPLIGAVRELLIAQGVPQITRHILFLHRTLQERPVRVYVKIGTTGTGGMGINIPYTHSEDKPSSQLLAKSAIGFAHTGLLFLLARTPTPPPPETDLERVDPKGSRLRLSRERPIRRSYRPIRRSYR